VKLLAGFRCMIE